MIKEIKGILFILGFLIIILIISKILNFYVEKKMYPVEINSVIYKVEVSPALRCDFYDSKGKQIKIYGYTFYESSGIKIGDMIVKKANSQELLIYRKDENGEYRLLYKKLPHNNISSR